MPSTLPALQRLFLDEKSDVVAEIAHYAFSTALYRNVISEMEQRSPPESFRAQVLESGGRLNGAPLGDEERGKVLLLDFDKDLIEKLSPFADVFVDALDCDLDDCPDLIVGSLRRLQKILLFVELAPAVRAIVYDFPGTEAKASEKLSKAGIYFFGEDVAFDRVVPHVLKMYAHRVQMTLPVEAEKAFIHRASILRTHDENNLKTISQIETRMTRRRKAIAAQGGGAASMLF